MAISVENRQRRTTPVSNDGEFDIGGNEHYEGTVEFDEDMLDFCFSVKMFNEPVHVYVRLYEHGTKNELFGGYGEIRIPPDTEDKFYLSFDGFGWRDEEMRDRVRKCDYEIWLDGMIVEYVRVNLYV